MRDKRSALAPWIMVYLQQLVTTHRQPDTYYYVDVKKLAKHLEVDPHTIRNVLRALVKGGFLKLLPWETCRRIRPGSRKTVARLVNQYRITELGLSYDAAVPIFLNNMDRTKKELADHLEMRERVVEAAANKEIGGIAHLYDKEYKAELAAKYGRRWVKRKYG